MRKNDYVIIMAGGIGSRFWPMSRSTYPKQFHDILGIGKTLIRMTFDRFDNFIPHENIFVVTNQAYRDLLMEQIPEIPESNILLEPVGRNTAPCIAYACAKIHKIAPKATIFVAASDHLITNETGFKKLASLAMEVASKNPFIITLGIKPTRPDTGYGYIQYLEDEDHGGYFPVKLFTEKPELEVAKSFLASGDFLWNSGMFIFSVDTILKEFKEHLPDMYDQFMEISEFYYTDQEADKIQDVYTRSRNISIDYGIMEKAGKEGNVYVIPSSFGWSDLGTWGSMYEHMEKDYLGNAVQGNAILYQSSNNVIKVRDKNKLVVLDGLDGYIVVDTGDVLMICLKEDEQMIKEFVADVRSSQSGKFV
ncbi:MAG: mannose-1-phosphate guanylyltransferase [Bacteroidia bacterium]|nr:mannose-1-phosphate guanylyltransferase [Bacteroidia bacterium]